MLFGISIYFGLEALWLGLWTNATPGPGLFPFAVAVALLGISGSTVVRAFVADGGDAFTSVAFLGAGILVAYAAMLSLTGFVLATLLFVVAWCTVLYRKTAALAIIMAVLSTVGCLAVFRFALGLPIEL